MIFLSRSLRAKHLASSGSLAVAKHDGTVNIKSSPKPSWKYQFGRDLFENKNLLEFDDRQMREVRGKDISMIFQEPMTSLNPVLTIGYQIEEVLKNTWGFQRLTQEKNDCPFRTRKNTGS